MSISARMARWANRLALVEGASLLYVMGIAELHIKWVEVVKRSEADGIEIELKTSRSTIGTFRCALVLQIR